MKKIIHYILLLLALTLTGCPDSMLQVQAQTANAVAHAANTGLPMLVDKYAQEGHRAIDAVADAGGTRDQAEAALQRVKDKWAPIWKAWESLRIAEDAWATVLEQGGDTGAILKELKNAYCELQAVWPSDIPAIPLAPLQCAPSTLGKVSPAPDADVPVAPPPAKTDPKPEPDEPKPVPAAPPPAPTDAGSPGGTPS